MYRFKRQDLDNRGFHHILIPLILVVLFGIIGAYYLVATHAVTSNSGSITSGYSGKCLDDSNNSQVLGNPLDITSCNNSASQQWQVNGNDTLQLAGTTLCIGIGVVGPTGATYQQVQIHTCRMTGSSLTKSYQQWQVVNGDTLKNVHTGKCLTVMGSGTSVPIDGTQLLLSDCSTTVTNNQVWHLPAAVVATKPTVTLMATPTTVTSGQTATLTWTSSDATSCSASGAWSGSQATAGTATTAPLTVNATFNLSCSGAGGSATASANVAVTTGTTTATCPAPNPAAPVTGYAIAACEDFNNGLGAFHAYNGGGGSTVVGVGRVPSQCQVNSGYLHELQGSDGATCGGSLPTFSHQQGLWEVRMRAYSTGTNGSAPHPVLILWPDTGIHNDGELDYFEANLGSPAHAYLHCVGSNPSQNCYSAPASSVDYSQWHVYSIKWDSGSMTGYIDGQQWWTTTGTGFVPSVSMHQTIQLDNLSGITPVKAGEMDVDWVHMFTRT